MEPRDFRTAIDAAEQAAAASDFASAERLLREAARLQEDALGPVHPDLANTLNNLGIVCENLGKPDDAGAFYQRASEMAAATLPPDHPFVATSRRNFEDFNRWRIGPPPTVSAAEMNRAVELGLDAFPEAQAKSSSPEPATAMPPAAAPPPTLTRAPATSPSQTARPKAAKPPARPNSTAPQTPPASPKPVAAPSTRTSLPVTPQRPAEVPRWMVPALAAAAILAVVLMATRPWAGTESTADTPDADPSASQPQPSVEPPAPAPAAQDAPPRAEAPAPAATRDVEAAPPPKATPPPAAPTSSSTTRLAVAEVCQAFSTGSGAWRCDPVENEASPGRLAFYTRVRSPRATTIVHRWYQGDRLRQTVTLQVGANSGAGYRTYSRQTVDAGSEWRVEARTGDGAVLHEERFVVK